MQSDDAPHAPEALKEEKKTEAFARASRASPPPLPYGRSGDALPALPNGAPVPGADTPTGGGGGDPLDDGGESKAWMSRQLGRTVHLEADRPETVTEDDRPKTEADRERMAARMAEQTAALVAELRMRAVAPGLAPRFTADEQADIARGMVRAKPYFLTGEALLAARRAAGIPVAASP